MAFVVMKLTILLVITVALSALPGCDTDQEQHVAIRVSRGQTTASGLEVRLHQYQQCKGHFERRTLAKNGTTTFSRTVEIGGLSVIIDELSVCIESDGLWRPILSSVHGPAPAFIEVVCDLDKAAGQCAIRFDGSPVDVSTDDK